MTMLDNTITPIDNKRLNTKKKILDVAENLFAERGFTETSLRMITSFADVNLASVNYHFGSKKRLIQAVFDRFLALFIENLNRQLDILEKKSTTHSVEEVLETMVKPLFSLDQYQQNGTSKFMQLIGRAYSESQGHIRRFLMEKYALPMERFYRLIYASLPDHSSYEVFLKLHFTLGAVIFTFAGNQALTAIADADFNEKLDAQVLTQKLIPYLSNGLRANTKLESQNLNPSADTLPRSKK